MSEVTLARSSSNNGNSSSTRVAQMWQQKLASGKQLQSEFFDIFYYIFIFVSAFKSGEKNKRVVLLRSLKNLRCSSW